MKQTRHRTWAIGIVASAMIGVFSNLTYDAGLIYCSFGAPTEPTPTVLTQLRFLWLFLAYVAPGLLIGFISDEATINVSIFSYVLGLQFIFVRIFRDSFLSGPGSLNLWQVLRNLVIVQAVFLLFGITVALVASRLRKRLTMERSRVASP